MTWRGLSPCTTATETACCNYQSLHAWSLCPATREATARTATREQPLCTARRESPLAARKTQLQPKIKINKCILDAKFLMLLPCFSLLMASCNIWDNMTHQSFQIRSQLAFSASASDAGCYWLLLLIPHHCPL